MVLLGIVYFSRTGEQYSVGNITEGNTAIVAGMIADKTGGSLFEIKVADDVYPAGYSELIKFAQKEKRQKARPAITGTVDNFAEYDTVFIGYPNWWAEMPMPVYTFLESHDFTGKNVVPFCTHEGSGFGGTDEKVRDVTRARMLRGFAIYGHTAQKDRDFAREKVNEWFSSIGF